MRDPSGTPVFQAVVDLGLRDVGIRNDPRRFAVTGVKALMVTVVLVVVAASATCLLAVQAGVDGALAGAFLAACAVGTALLVLRTLKRLPPAVVRVSADGRNQAVSLFALPMVACSALLVLMIGPEVAPLALLAVVHVALVWRHRELVPAALRELRARLAPGEVVLGDGVGLASGKRGHQALRLLAATDRRLLITGSPRAPGPLVIADVPYDDVSSFGIAWRFRGRAGALSVTLAATGDGPPQTLEIVSITPANLVSIAQALRLRGVRAVDEGAVDAAARGWEAARHRAQRPAEPGDREAIDSVRFDRGLWLLLGVAVLALYLNPFGIGVGVTRNVLPVLPVIALAGLAAGFVAGTRRAVAYLAPLNLLVVPVFFFAPAADVVVLMAVMSALAALGLIAGAALRAARPPETAGPAQRPGRTLEVLRGAGIVRLSRLMLAGFAALMTTATALGFEPLALRLGVDEAIGSQLPVDGRSDLTGKAARLAYTPGRGLREFVTDERWSDDPADGARWELRSASNDGQDFVSLASYVFEPHLDDPAAVAEFVAEKDREHSEIAGHPVTHTQRRVDGRTGYVWEHGNSRGYWHFAVWFPAAEHSVRLECIARDELDRFQRLCAEATATLRFR